MADSGTLVVDLGERGHEGRGREIHHALRRRGGRQRHILLGLDAAHGPLRGVLDQARESPNLVVMHLGQRSGGRILVPQSLQREGSYRQRNVRR